MVSDIISIPWWRVKTKIMKKVFNILLIGLLIYSLFGCMFEPYEPACTQGEYIHGMVCPELYEPVCSPDGTTYANVCYAVKDGWEEDCVIENECNG